MLNVILLFSQKNVSFAFSISFSVSIWKSKLFPTLLFVSHLKFQVKLQNEMNLRMKAESSAALAEEKASSLEGKLSHLSESTEREKKRLHKDLAHLKKESELSVARITADVSGGFY